MCFSSKTECFFEGLPFSREKSLLGPPQKVYIGPEPVLALKQPFLAIGPTSFEDGFKMVILGPGHRADN